MISKGFITLVEVMIILSILGILSAIIIPAIMGGNQNISYGFNGTVEVRCIRGVQFVIGHEGTSTQIIDPYGKGIPCNQ